MAGDSFDSIASHYNLASEKHKINFVVSWIFKYNNEDEMKRTISCILFGFAVASSLAACTSTGTDTVVAKNDNAAPCREVGLSDAKDSRMGQLDCSPVVQTAK